MQLSMDAFLTPTETPNQSGAANRAVIRVYDEAGNMIETHDHEW